MHKKIHKYFFSRPKKIVCWSPGTPDIDCPTGDTQEPFGLCCFDGCQNSCFKSKGILPKGHYWKGTKDITKGDTNKEDTQCFEVEKNVCEMVPQPELCKEVPKKPFEVCKETNICKEASKIEICTVSGITEISQECTEKM